MLQLSLFERTYPVVNLVTDEVFSVDAPNAEGALLNLFSDVLGISSPEEQVWVGEFTVALGDYAVIFDDGI